MPIPPKKNRGRADTQRMSRADSRRLKGIATSRSRILIPVRLVDHSRGPLDHLVQVIIGQQANANVARYNTSRVR